MIDITKLKNDKERVEFLEDYSNEQNGWYIWCESDATDMKWWRYDLDDCALIVKERYQTISYPKPERKWIVSKWYIIHDWRAPFSDGAASRTMALAEIKKRARK